MNYRLFTVPEAIRGQPRRASRGLLALLATLASAAAAGAADAPPAAWNRVFRTETPAGQDLRGFGRVAGDCAGYQDGSRRVWVQGFACADPGKAATVIGKFLADVGMSPKAAPLKLTVAGQQVPALAASGCVFIGCVDGSQGRIVAGTSADDLAAFLAGDPTLARGAVESAPYPVWLDRFDRYGWGLYGIEGTRSTEWMGWAAKADGKPGLKDPLEDLTWLAGMKNRFEPHLDPAQDNHADGIIANADDDWATKMAGEQGLPVSFRLYGSVNSDHHGWALRRFGEYQNRPAEFLTPRTGSYAVELMLSWYADDVHRYQAVKAMEMLQRYTDRPNVLGWMHPYGEIQVGTWEYDHGDYGPFAQRSWRAYLQKRGCSLADATRMYNRESPFADWEQVTLPEYATFAGLDGQVATLGGQWWSRPEIPRDQAIDDAWWKQAPEERYRGLREHWWDGAVDTKDWRLATMPGGGADAAIGEPTSATMTTWFRREVTLTPQQLAKTPVYLYWFPISHEGIHSGEHRRFHEVYVNGTRAGEIGTWGAIDVTSLLKPGDNRIALHLYANLWQGRIFLSTEAPSLFPGLPGGKNELWQLWRRWLNDIPGGQIATVLDGMRQVDPNRPIKVMAPSGGYVQLCTKYGAYPHFTGEGMWFFPWYKRTAYLYDVPGSSETAGPANTVEDQAAAYRRVFMAGLNAHDPVFSVQSYSRNPALRAWWEAHQRVLRQLGQYDIAGPQQLLILRSGLGGSGISPYPAIGDSARTPQLAWNWDLGRGTLQSIGQSYLYLDEQGIADGKMNRYRVMMDCGTEIIDPATCDRLGDWVRSGGTFIALPFTGRSSPLARDSWPIAKISGCAVGTWRKTGAGTVTIAAKQSLFAVHAGKSFPDNGSSMDWVGNETNDASLELKPGADCEVIASYENGEPAVVRHRLGAGSVITLGSAFWRRSHDIRGIWWPSSPEPELVADLLAGLGQPSPCETDGKLVWPQPYRSNNGLDQVAVLTSWNDAEDVTSTLRMRLPAKPAALVAIGVDGELDLPFTWKDGVAEAKVPMPAREVKVVRALGTADPLDAVGHWWGYQQRMWHELVKPTIDFAPYRTGKFADPTLELRLQARFTATPPADDAWQRAGFDDSAWTASPLSMFRFWGAAPAHPLWVRKTFRVPEAWLRKAGQIRLVCVLGGSEYNESAVVRMNGTAIEGNFADRHVDVELRRLLLPGENVLSLEFPGHSPEQSVQGEVYLYFRPEAVLSLPLHAGEQTVMIPRSWEGRYRAMLYLEGGRYTICGAAVGNHSLGRWPPVPAPAEYNLTAYLRYGQENRIWVPSAPGPEDVRVSRLDLFPIDE